MKCVCRNCKYCNMCVDKTENVGLYCENRMIFVEPNDNCTDFDTDFDEQGFVTTCVGIAIVVILAVCAIGSLIG